MRDSAKECFELLAEFVEAIPEYVYEGIGANDGHSSELIDCAGVLDLVAQIGHIFKGGLDFLTVSDGFVPGKQQVYRFLGVGTSTERK